MKDTQKGLNYVIRLAINGVQNNGQLLGYLSNTAPYVVIHRRFRDHIREWYLTVKTDPETLTHMLCNSFEDARGLIQQEHKGFRQFILDGTKAWELDLFDDVAATQVILSLK